MENDKQTAIRFLRAYAQDKDPKTFKDPSMVFAQFAYYGQLDCMKVLKKVRPTLDTNWEHSPNHRGPLHGACRMNHASIVRYLLSIKSVDPNMVSREGSDTPFMLACKSNSVNAVREMLLHPDVDVEMPDEEGNTPFAEAISHGHTEVARLLVASGRCKNFTVGKILKKRRTAEITQISRSLKKSTLRIPIALSYGGEFVGNLMLETLVLIHLTKHRFLKPKKKSKESRFLHVMGQLPSDFKKAVFGKLFPHPQGKEIFDEAMKNREMYRSFCRKLL